MGNNQLFFDDLESFLNKTLAIQFEPTVVIDSELIELVKLPKFGDLPIDPFSFIVRTSQKDNYYPQATYLLHHPEKGSIPVFFVPIGKDEKGMKYQAIFN